MIDDHKYIHTYHMGICKSKPLVILTVTAIIKPHPKKEAVKNPSEEALASTVKNPSVYEKRALASTST